MFDTSVLDIYPLYKIAMQQKMWKPFSQQNYLHKSTNHMVTPYRPFRQAAHWNIHPMVTKFQGSTWAAIQYQS